MSCAQTRSLIHAKGERPGFNDGGHRHHLRSDPLVIA
jgi:hypothetical protein